MKLKYLTFAIALIGFTACGDDTGESTDGGEDAATSTATSLETGAPTEGVVNTQQQLGNPSENVVQQPGAGVSNPNPPHGEPGHKCEVPVGVSLDAAPDGAPVATSAQINTTQSTPGVTAEGMNPPHGEPGHDCGVAVGAPLPVK